jgi:drug/metabolite transporter, DME family
MILRSLALRCPAMLLNSLRSLVATGGYIAVILLTGRVALYARIRPSDLVYLGINLGISIMLGDAAYYASMRLIGVSRALTVSSVYPLLTAIIAGPLLGEVFGWRTWAGFVLCVGGVLLVSRSGVRTGDPAPARRMQRGVFLGLASACAWAVGTVALRRGSLGLDPFVVNSIRLSGVAVFAGIWAGARHELGHVRRFGRRGWAELVASGLIGAVVGATLYLTAVQRAGASKAAVLAALAPLFSVPMAALAGEPVNRRLIAGIAVTVGGVALVV